MLNWTQPICPACYEKRNPGRVPTRVKEITLQEPCCDCGSPNEGIYFRVDPSTVKFPKPLPEGPKYSEVSLAVPDNIRPILDKANELIKQGSVIYFKWTCLKCGSRQSFEEPNKLYLEGQCEECEHISDLADPNAALNFLLMHADPTPEDFARILGGRRKTS